MKKEAPVAEPDGLLKKHLFSILLGAVVVITFVIYLPTLSHQFTNWDDGVYVTGNPYITSLSKANLVRMFTRPIAANYHPLTILSLALNYKIGGLSPVSYFLVNILFHLANVILVFRFILLLPGRNRAMALFVAALFAVHPMHVESVAWISERKDVLYTFFFLLGLICYLHFRDRKSWGYYSLSLVLFLLSALSKPTAVIFPLALFLIDYLRKRKASAGLFLEKLPFLAIAAWIGLQTISSQTEMVTGDMENFNALQRLVFASYGFCMYIFKLIVPAGLSAFYPFPMHDRSGAMPLIYMMMPFVAAILVAGAALTLRHTRLMVFGLLFYFLSVALTLQVVQVGHVVIADRYTYLAYIGLLIALFWVAERYIPERKIASVSLLHVVLLLFFLVNAAIAIARVPVWQNSGTLWTDVIEKHPGAAEAYSNRGLYYFDLKRYDETIADYTRAIEANPKYFEAYYNRGGAYLQVNKYREAVNDLTVAGKLNPNYSVSFRLKGDAYNQLGMVDSALLAYGEAIRVNAGSVESFINRGSIYLSNGMNDKALADFRRAVELKGDDAGTWFNLGSAYGKLGNFPEAIIALTRALDIKPDYYPALTGRAIAYASTGKGEETLRDLAEAIRIEPENPSAYFNRALFFLNNGKRDMACPDLKKSADCGNQDARAIWEKECGRQ